MKRVLQVVAVLVLVLFAGAGTLVYLTEREDPPPAAKPVDPAAQVARGKYLALAGNCVACHTVRGGAEYAGGREVRTPFGSVFASNLTPDAKTGIGTWSADDFWRAMHHGKSKDGRLLYPAFPYPNYTLVTRADADALFAWLRTIPAVEQPNRAHALRFPYNQSALLLGWRALYFKPGTFQEQPRHSAEWNRGAYLVQGLGHCNACHTARDPLGGSDVKQDLAGGMIPVLDWYAPALTSDPKTGLGEWDQQALVSLLKTGVAARGAVYGPMSEVVYKSLQHLSDTDLQAMTGYLKSLPATNAPASSAPASLPKEDLERIMVKGGALYEKHCATCHAADGKGFAPAYPPLAGNHALNQPTAANPIRLVLHGGYPPGTAGNPRPYGMPPFRAVLGNEEVALVLTYVRRSWGNQGRVVAPFEVSRYEALPLD
jgi:mono/diheme cytochrome c family protein